jgi:sugar phosphate isomerase/epimerase
MNRRSFIRNSALVLPGTLLGRGPVERTGSPNLKLSLAAYSFRNQFKWFKNRRNKNGGEMTLHHFVDYCANQRIPAAEITTYFFEPEVREDALLGLRLHAQNRGVALSGTAIGNNFSIGKGLLLDKQISETKAWIDKTALLGASHMRVFPGLAKDFINSPVRMGEAIDALQECSDYGEQKGVVVGVENHGNMSVEQILYILESVDSSWFGINLDTSNYIVETDDELYDAITRSLPYAVNVQVKVKRKLPDGTKVEVDLKKMISLIEEAGYQGYVVLEYEEEAPREKVPEYIDLLKKIINPS